MLFRKLEEIRLSLWIEEEMRARFGSKGRAKEEILARYASLIYMGNGQLRVREGGGILFWPAARHFHRRRCRQGGAPGGQPRSRLVTTRPTPAKPGKVLERRNQILALMAARGFIFAGPGQRGQPAPR